MSKSEVHMRKSGSWKRAAALIVLSTLLLFIVSACGSGNGPGAGSGINAGAIMKSTASNAATLTWTAPATNTDGTALTDLAGYNVYYGTSAGNYTNKINAGNVTTYTVSNLAAGTYYFAVTAYSSTGQESAYSNMGSKTISSTTPPPQTAGIAVTSPASGAVWYPGSTYKISWTYSGNVGSAVYIMLLRNGSLYSGIRYNVPIGTNGAGSYSWKIPRNLPSGSNYALGIRTLNCNYYGASGTFTIQ